MSNLLLWCWSRYYYLDMVSISFQVKLELSLDIFCIYYLQCDKQNLLGRIGIIWQYNWSSTENSRLYMLLKFQTEEIWGIRIFWIQDWIIYLKRIYRRFDFVRWRKMELDMRYILYPFKMEYQNCKCIFCRWCCTLYLACMLHNQVFYCSIANLLGN